MPKTGVPLARLPAAVKEVIILTVFAVCAESLKTNPVSLGCSMYGGQTEAVDGVRKYLNLNMTPKQGESVFNLWACGDGKVAGGFARLGGLAAHQARGD